MEKGSPDRLLAQILSAYPHRHGDASDFALGLLTV
jgi:hypothetical protein